MFAFMACSQTESISNDQNVDTSLTKTLSDTFKKAKYVVTERQSFKNIAAVVQDKESNAWVELKDGGASLALHFNLHNDDTLEVSYSSECWLTYPYKFDEKKITVYWDNNIDTKYDFDIVKAINQTDRNYIGKPFMILELINDTTLKATYPIPTLIRKVNSSSAKSSKFFPDQFIVSKEFHE